MATLKATSISGTLSMGNNRISLGGNNFIENRSTLNHTGRAFSYPSGAGHITIQAWTGSTDIGALQLTEDYAFICNSADAGYAFAVFDTDLTHNTYDFSNTDNAEFVVLPTGSGTKIRSRLYANGGIDVSGGHIYLTGANSSSSVSSTTQIVFGTSNSNHVVISSNDDNLIINPSTSDTTGQIELHCGSDPYVSVSGTHVSLEGHNHDSSYLKLSGGTITSDINRDAGGSWISARDNCVIKTTRTSAQGNDWHPAVGVKTSSGFWSFGSVGGETLAFSYDTDYNYTHSNNTSNVLYVPNKSGTIAVDGDSQPADGGNSDTVDSCHAWEILKAINGNNIRSNFNNIWSRGAYQVNDPSTGTPAHWGVLYVSGTADAKSDGGTWNWQFFHSTNGRLYARQAINQGDWGSWNTIAFTSDVPSLSYSNGTLTIN